jgi:hypothetical protein
VASLGDSHTTATTQPGTSQPAAPAATSGPGGGGGSTGGEAPSSRGQGHTVMSGGGNYADALKYAHCMRSHGVADFPDPSTDGNFSFDNTNGIGLGSPQFQAADKTCRILLPNGGQPTPAQQAQFMAQALKFSRCMRAHGILDFPDPSSGGLTIHGGPGSDLNPGNPRFSAAQSACQRYRPKP